LFEGRIKNAQRKLDLQTRQPVEVIASPFKYYYSTNGQLLDFNQSKSFCQSWGGNLSVISNEAEYKKMFDFQGTAKNEFWYGDNPKLTEFTLKMDT